MKQGLWVLIILQQIDFFAAVSQRQILKDQVIGSNW